MMNRGRSERARRALVVSLSEHAGAGVHAALRHAGFTAELAATSDDARPTIARGKLDAVIAVPPHRASQQADNLLELSAETSHRIPWVFVVEPQQLRWWVGHLHDQPAFGVVASTHLDHHLRWLLQGAIGEPPSSLAARIEGERELADAIASVLELCDVETEAHSRRVAMLSELIGEALGLGIDDRHWLGIGALVHDVGKIVVPLEVLHKPSALSAVEWDVVRQHARIGAKIVGRFPLIERAREAVLYHHERWDGRGYPAGFGGEDIPLAARIVAVADTYDAMTSARPYRPAAPHAHAIEQLARGGGTQFDPAVVEAALSLPEARWAMIRSVKELAATM